MIYNPKVYGRMLADVVRDEWKRERDENGRFIVDNPYRFAKTPSGTLTQDIKRGRFFKPAKRK